MGEAVRRSLDSSDLPTKLRADDLWQDVANLLARRAQRGRHHLACGMRLSSEGAVCGINVVSNLGPASTCAEQLTLAEVLRDRPEDQILLVLTLRATFGQDDPYEIVPPCGRCRELLCEYAPQTYVLLPGSHADQPLDFVPVISLLPRPFCRRTFGTLIPGPLASERSTKYE